MDLMLTLNVISMGYYYYAGAMTTTKWGGSCEEPVQKSMLREASMLLCERLYADLQEQ